jgi:hypothetical protein
MPDSKKDPRPLSPNQAADQVRDAGTVAALAQIGILAHADEIAATQSVRLNREALRLARKYGATSPEAVQAARRIDMHQSYRSALGTELERATIPVPPSDPAAATIYGRVFSADGKPQPKAKVEAVAAGQPLQSATSGADGLYLMRVPLKAQQDVTLRALAAGGAEAQVLVESGPIRIDQGSRTFHDLRIPAQQTPPRPQPGGGDTSPATSEMPDLTGLNESDARAVLERLGITAVRVVTETVAGARPGTVVKQTPAKGAAVGPSTHVALVVSARPPIKAPALRGMTLQEAIVRLNQLGLQVGKVTGDREKGRVTGQAPRSGADIAPGGTVDLRLGRAG